MNRDEILSKSRKENKDKDLYQQEVLINAGNYSAITAILLASVFFVTRVLVGGGWDFGLYAIVFSIGAASFIAKSIHMKRRRDIALSILYTLAALILSIVHMYGLITGKGIM